MFKKIYNKLYDLRYTAVYIIQWTIFYFVSVFIKNNVLNIIENSSSSVVEAGLFNLVEVHNKGAAFSLFSKYPDVIAVSSFIAILILSSIIFVYPKKLNYFSVFALSLLSAGIFMNMVERISEGYVIDYFQFSFFREFPVFNCADIMIVSGALFLICSILSKKQEAK